MGSSRTTTSKLNGVAALQPRRRGQRLLADRHGLPRRRGTRPIRSRSAPIDEGLIGRFGAIDPTDGGDTYRYSGSVEWQRSARQRVDEGRRRTASATTSNLFSNFTYFLDDPVHGDQFEQADHRFITGAKVEPSAPRPLGRPRGAEHVRRAGAQRRHHQRRPVSHARRGSCSTRVRQDAVRRDERRRSTRRTRSSGRRGCARWPACASTATASASTRSDPENGGTTTRRASSARRAASCSVRCRGTEFYVNAGLGFHSNDARGDDDHARSGDRRAGRSGDAARPREGRRGRASARSRFRTCRRALTVWTLALDSELVFAGDAGHDRAGPAEPPLRRRVRELLQPAAVARCSTATSRWSRARFTDVDPVGDHIPGVGRRRVVSRRRDGRQPAQRVRQRAAALLRSARRSSRTTRCGRRRRAWSTSRPATSSPKHVRARASTSSTCSTPQDSDIDYYYASRLPGEPAGGVDDIHFHPAAPRTARISFIVGR